MTIVVAWVSFFAGYANDEMIDRPSSGTINTKMKKLILMIGGIILASVVFMALLMTPFAYLVGTAKSDWFKQTRGLDIPWYRATWLNVQINDVDADVRSR